MQAKLVLHGILALEHCGVPAFENDGVCFTCLVSLGPRTEPESPTAEFNDTASLAAKIAAKFSISSQTNDSTFDVTCKDYAWIVIKDDGLSKLLHDRLGKHMTIPLNRNAEFEEMLIPFR